MAPTDVLIAVAVATQGISSEVAHSRKRNRLAPLAASLKVQVGTMGMMDTEQIEHDSLAHMTDKAAHLELRSVGALVVDAVADSKMWAVVKAVSGH